MTRNHRSAAASSALTTTSAIALYAASKTLASPTSPLAWISTAASTTKTPLAPALTCGSTKRWNLPPESFRHQVSPSPFLAQHSRFHIREIDQNPINQNRDSGPISGACNARQSRKCLRLRPYSSVTHELPCDPQLAARPLAQKSSRTSSQAVECKALCTQQQLGHQIISHRPPPPPPPQQQLGHQIILHRRKFGPRTKSAKATLGKHCDCEGNRVRATARWETQYVADESFVQGAQGRVLRLLGPVNSASSKGFSESLDREYLNHAKYKTRTRLCVSRP